MRRFLDVLNAAVAAAVVGFAVWAWPRLPAEIPAHFGPDGRPDRWTETSLFGWFLLPALGVVCWGGILWARRWMLARPERVNLPGGGTLADQPEGRRPAVADQMRLFLALVTLEMLVIFGLIVVGQFRTANGADGQGMLLLVMALAVLSTPVLLIVYFRGMQRITRSPGPGSDRSAPHAGPGARMPRPPRG